MSPLRGLFASSKREYEPGDGGSFVAYADPRLDDPITRQIGVSEMRRPPVMNDVTEENRARRAEKLAIFGATLADMGASLQGREADAIERTVADQKANAARERLRRLMSGAYGGDAAVGNGVPPGYRAAQQRAAFQVAGEALPQTGAAQKKHELRMALADAAQRGVDVRPYVWMMERDEDDGTRDAFLASLPQADRAEATLDPKGYIGWRREQRTPKFFSPGGGAVVAVDPQRGVGREIYRAPTKVDPPSTDDITAAALSRYTQGLPLNKQQEAIVNRFLNGTDSADQRPTTSTVLGGVLTKVQQSGVESLTPGERAIWDRYNRADAFEALLAGNRGGDDEGGLTPPGPAPARSPTAAPGRSGGDAAKLPPQAMSRLKEQQGREVVFNNGERWAYRNGQAVYLGSAR